MILPPRRYLALAAAAFLAVVTLRLGAAIWADPFADFLFLTGIKTGSQHTVENFTERKIKRRLVDDAAPNTVSAAIFGNSRSAALNPGEGAFARRFPNALNLSFSGADANDISAMLELALERQPGLVPIVGLDLDECFRTPDNGRRPVLYVSPELDSAARQDALARLTSLSALVEWARAGAMGMTFDQEILPNGAVRREIGAAARIERARRDRSIYTAWFGRPYDSGCSGKVRALRAMAPNAIFVINPMAPALEQVVAQTGARERFRASLAGLGPVLDMSCAPQWRDEDFVDGHHYGTAAARTILDQVARVAAGGQPATGCLIR